MKRRFFLFAAPAIVAAPSLMRVSTLPAALTVEYGTRLSFGELVTSTLRARSEEVWLSVSSQNALLQAMTGVSDSLRGLPNAEGPIFHLTS